MLATQKNKHNNNQFARMGDAKCTQVFSKKKCKDNTVKTVQTVCSCVLVRLRPSIITHLLSKHPVSDTLSQWDMDRLGIFTGKRKYEFLETMLCRVISQYMDLSI